MQAQKIKKANLGGGGGETEFEQAFSSLAYAYLRDKAPRLLDHMVGFQLLDRNEDNTKAVGVFGFNISSQWLYAPVFFLNGDLKGHELLYIKKNDSFVPMKENWVNYLMGRKPHVLGEGSARKLQELGGVYPDIRSLSISPTIGGGKRASDDWVKPVLPLAAAFKTKAASSLYKGEKGNKLSQKAIVEEPTAAALAKSAQNLDFNQVMPTSFDLIKAAHAISEQYPGIKKAFQDFYGVDCFSRWAKESKEKLENDFSSIIPEKKADAKPYMPGNLLIATERPTAPVDHEKSGKLRMYVYEQVSVRMAPELDEDQRAKLLNDKVLIEDHREGEEVSRAYNTQVEAQLTNPSETALYRVLVKPGEFQKMLIAMNGSSNRGREAMATVVRLEGNGEGPDKAWLNTHPTNVFADQISEKSEWEEWFNGLSGSESLSEGGEYIGIDEHGSATVPFHVQSDYGDGRYRVDFRCHIDWNETRPVTMPRIANNRSLRFGDDADHTPSPYGAMLYLDKEGKRGTKIRAIAGELRIPEGFKFIQLSGKQEPEAGELMPCCYECRSDMPPINLGKIDDIHLLFHEKTASLELHHNGTDVYISTGGLPVQKFSPPTALFNLVSVHGLREKVAREILKKAEAKNFAHYRVFHAPGYGLEKSAAPTNSVLANGPSAPIFDDFSEERSLEQYGPRTAVPTQFGGEQAYRLDALSAEQTDPAVYDPWQNYEAEDFQTSLQVAQQAGASGQKEVFDTSMLSGLLKSVRQDSLVERYLGTLMESLDALGRLLMNFYWHQEEFEDRYGKADLPELEDSIRNAFESLGDITIFLKEKTIESPFDDGDLNLEETARN